MASDLGAIALALLASGHRGVAIDLPAHGRSAGKSTSIPASARALLQAAPALGPLHALVAHSVGSAVAVTAMARGLAVGRAVLLAAPAHYVEYARFFAQQAGLDAAQAREMIDRLRDEGVDVHAHSAPVLARQLSQPALYVHSADDQVVAIADAEAASSAWPGARLLRMKASGTVDCCRTRRWWVPSPSSSSGQSNRWARTGNSCPSLPERRCADDTAQL